MPTVKRSCRVCGKQYKACRTLMPNGSDVFRWQDVACSPECGAEYLRRVNKSRGLISSSEDLSNDNDRT